ncbi:hypothetical protein Fmac_005677 [Flemingia macrophylla]|uniref:Reverse transcriptase Ty1/copia-type domain-containing protein n=1 Tax=Flemingia macrophylla TaxID=520843 RepID=A0ABD1N8F4_9FABA
MGFHAARCDSSLFVQFTKTSVTYILVYVDDIIITESSPNLIQQFISKLNNLFLLKDLGPLHFFLGIEVHRSKDGVVLLSQSKYIHDILTRVHMSNAKPIKTPLAPGLKLQIDSTEVFEDPTLYRSILGALQYATIPLPDVAFAINKLCQFMHHPLISHWKAVKRVHRYLNGTLDQGLVFHPSPDLNITGLCDSDWACDNSDIRSTSGYSIYLGKNLVS